MKKIICLLFMLLVSAQAGFSQSAINLDDSPQSMPSQEVAMAAQYLSYNVYQDSTASGPRLNNQHIGLGLGLGALVSLNAFYELPLTEFGVGPYINYSSFFGIGALTVGGRGAYYFDMIDNEQVESYAGLTLGVNTLTETGFSNAFLAYRVFGGLRYNFKENLGVYGEVGLGTILPSFLNLGVNFNL